MNKYINCLSKMYNHHYSNDGKCDCVEECKNSICYNNVAYHDNSIICNKNVKVGIEYGSNKYPKVLIIGKEPTNSQIVIEEPASFFNQKNQHYKRTFAILCKLIFGCQIDDYNGYNESEGNRKDYIKIANKYFALTNHYHCAYKKSVKKHGIKCSDVMWDNCAEIVKKEINILQPDIIVIQAGWTANSSESKKRVSGIKMMMPEAITILREDEKHRTLYWAGTDNQEKKICIIGSYHPSYPLWHYKLDELKCNLSVARLWWESDNKE